MTGFLEDNETLLDAETKTKKPKRYRVLMMNDDYTTMEFVVFVLQEVFNKTPSQAEALMLAVHTTGQGVAGVYTYEVAEAKINQTIQLARQYEFPLRCVMEED